MGHKSQLLILEDEPDVLKEISAHLSDSFEVTGVTTLKEARRTFSEEPDMERYRVLVADMRLQKDDEGGLILAQELSVREIRPEVVVLTAFPNFKNASKCMQVDTFGYIEKGQSDTYETLEEMCLKAEKNWYRKYQRIPEYMLEIPIALLFGEVDATIDLPAQIEESEDRASIMASATCRGTACRALSPWLYETA